MNRKKWIAFALACGMMVSLTGNAVVMGSDDDVFIGDDPYGGGVPGDNYTEEPPVEEPPVEEPPVEEPPVEEPPVTEPPQTDAPPATEPPQTDAPPVVSVPEDPAPSYGNGTPAGGYYGDYTDYNYDVDYSDSSDNEEKSDGDEEKDAGKEYSIDDFELFDAEDAKRDFALPEADKLPNQIYLRVPEILQEPELPTGCEVTALTMVLQYEEIEAEKTDIVDNYLLYNREDDNLAVGYVGDPYDVTGAGCFAPALTATADSFFEDKELDYRAYDITDTPFEDLYAYVATGTPVMVWTTMYMEEPEFTEEVGEYNDREYPWYRQEHCVVLSGYNIEEGTVQVNDPIEGIVERDMAAFEDIYVKTGMNAVVIREQEKEEPVTVSAVSTQTETPEE